MASVPKDVENTDSQSYREKNEEIRIERSESLDGLPDPDVGKSEAERRKIVRSHMHYIVHLLILRGSSLDVESRSLVDSVALSTLLAVLLRQNQYRKRSPRWHGRRFGHGRTRLQQLLDHLLRVFKFSKVGPPLTENRSATLLQSLSRTYYSSD